MEAVALALGTMGFIFGAAAMAQVNELKKEFKHFRESADEPPSSN